MENGTLEKIVNITKHIAYAGHVMKDNLTDGEISAQSPAPMGSSIGQVDIDFGCCIYKNTVGMEAGCRM